jgi:hypothetical protein
MCPAFSPTFSQTKYRHFWHGNQGDPLVCKEQGKSLNWANGKTGILGVPTVGEFRNGRGVFVDQESFNDRAILVRNSFMDITPNSARFEQTFSDGGGETWETNWVMTFTRLKPADKGRD